MCQSVWALELTLKTTIESLYSLFLTDNSCVHGLTWLVWFTCGWLDTSLDFFTQCWFQSFFWKQCIYWNFTTGTMYCTYCTIQYLIVQYLILQNFMQRRCCTLQKEAVDIGGFHPCTDWSRHSKCPFWLEPNFQVWKLQRIVALWSSSGPNSAKFHFVCQSVVADNSDFWTKYRMLRSIKHMRKSETEEGNVQNSIVELFYILYGCFSCCNTADGSCEANHNPEER